MWEAQMCQLRCLVFAKDDLTAIGCQIIVIKYARFAVSYSSQTTPADCWGSHHQICPPSAINRRDTLSIMCPDIQT